MADASHLLITPEIFHDQPLEPGRKGDEAFFRFEEYATTFARLIASPRTRTPLVIGVSGKWGSGKTTLLRLLRAKLDATDQPWPPDLTRVPFLNNTTETAEDIRRCRTVWFNAWKYADEDALLVALVRAILGEMARGDLNEKFWSAALNKDFPRRDVLATFISAFKIKFPGVEIGFDPDKTKTETPFATHGAFFDQFSAAFDQLLAVWVHGKLDAQKIEPERGVLVVFIDDLDRCLPAKTVQVLEAIKLFLDKTGAVFVIGADEDVIRSAVESHYQNQKITGLGAQDYLEKIFQIRFPLPPLPAAQMGDYMTHGLNLSAGLQTSIDLILAGAETNPRQIKTFINYLELSWAVLKNSGQAADEVRDDFTRWLALTRVAPEFCDRVRGLEDKELRLKFVNDAVTWARGLAEAPGFAEQNAVLVGTFKEYEGHLRLRRVLRQIAFSQRVNASVLEGFIFWSAPPPEAAPAPEAEAVRAARPQVIEPVSIPSEEAVGAPVIRRGEVVARAAWVKIPAGKFVMGSKPDNKWATDDEKPQHTVEIPYDYLIARTPVTNAQFREFAEVRKSDWKPSAPDDHPAVNVSWRDACAYCGWLTEKLRQSGEIAADEIVRLPTEAEWEKAARGEYGNEWPWGNEWDAGKCNSRESKIGGTTPVDHYSPAGDSPYGVADMAGNVWEWCSSLLKPYPYRRDDGREDLKAEGPRVVRGGAFVGVARLVRCASRYRDLPSSRYGAQGFRVVVSPVSPDSEL